MKTVVISDDDLFELEFLRERMEREIDLDRRAAETKAVRYGWPGAGRTEKEREASRAVEAINRILK